MKILFTGMGSHHCKKSENLNFFGMLSDLFSKEAEITWASPNILWKRGDLEKYDRIFFGFLPPTSLSANKIYGALNILNLMFDSPKLTLVVDSPQVWQYKNSIAAIIKNPSILFGTFYSKREGYESALRNTSNIESACSRMGASIWPKILYPSLPWNSDEKISALLGFGNLEATSGLNLDALHIEPEPARIGRKDQWAIENPKSSWYESLSSSIIFPQERTKVGRRANDSYALDVIRNSIGLILPPQERNLTTWWNCRMIQAMNASTPIVTYWQDTRKYSKSWSMLAYQVEDMSTSQRQILASTQRNVYLESLPSREETKESARIMLLDFTEERI